MKKILLIDDEKDFLNFIKEYLEPRGAFKVFVATNGRDGIDLAIHQNPDIIILDALMPVMGGFDVLKLLKSNKHTTTIPVIMLTAVDNDEAKEKAAGLYVEDFIVMVLDGASSHKCKDLKVPENITLVFLPPYSPELNPAEQIWNILRRNYFANRVFESLEAAIHQAELGLDRMACDSKGMQSLTNWPWINAILKNI